MPPLTPNALNSTHLRFDAISTDSGQISAVDPGHRLIGLHLYDGIFKAESAAIYVGGDDMPAQFVNR